MYRNQESRLSPKTLVRKHFEVAKAVLEIAQAQWAPKKEAVARYRMIAHDDHDDDDDHDGESDNSEAHEEPRIHMEVLNNQHTIENIGHVSMQVSSHTRAMDLLVRMSRLLLAICSSSLHQHCAPSYSLFYVLYGEGQNEALESGCPSPDPCRPKTSLTVKPLQNWEANTSLLQDDGLLDSVTESLLHAVVRVNDGAGLRLLLDMEEAFMGQGKDPDDFEPGSHYQVPELVFHEAIDRGHISMLSEMIKRLGTGMPLA